MTADLAALRRLRAEPGMSSLHRSLEYYYGDPARDAALDAFHARFVSPGDLVLDIGAHVGDRVGSFRRLGARVVAVEPQPLCVEALHALYGTDDEVTVVAAACGAEPGRVRLYVNSANPTVSTASPEFVRAADGAGGWEGQVWDGELEVPTVTVDALVAEHGTPAFVKIDVEGYEDVVLAGMSDPVPTMSFEFTTVERAVALRCLDRATALGFEGFDVSLGESLSFAHGRWLPASAIAAYLSELPHEANAGDVYCVPKIP
ncbi:FkbM family methyltransferase [Actinoplanes sp. NPDC049548]|uniref:FkbM family methyltransferase n=1 Tax=Actinoplanes sp. NPDC049548 TaxID=3155152 RepID=UPI00343174AC